MKRLKLVARMATTHYQLTRGFGTQIAALKEAEGNVVEITIKVKNRDVERAAQISLKPWNKTTDEERNEYDHLISLFGTAVCMKIINRD